MASPHIDKQPLELTPHEISVLSYILRRVQEDPDFFDSLVGDSDHQVTTRFKMTVAMMIERVKKAQA